LKATFSVAVATDPDPDPDPEEVSIYDLKQNLVDDDTAVKISGVVTAVDGNSFYIQVNPSDQDPVLKEKYSGILIYTPDGITPTFTFPNFLDKVTVSGVKTTYFDMIEVKDVTNVVINGSVSYFFPITLTPSEVQSFQYEGVFVDVGSVTVIEGFDTYNAFKVSNGLIVDDDLYKLNPDPVVGENYQIMGIMKYTFSAHRLLPRFHFDIVKTSP
jgi:predicted extracellular nuclease